MDQIKIGGFLRELRKEKELTQEQLAEKFGVSSRSVSRWENGNTMPELGILVELADYYEVDIKEIIDGERKSEIMKKEEKETLRKVADYAEAEKKLVVKHRCVVTFVGTLVCALSIMVGYVVFPKLSEDSFWRSDVLWLGIGIIGVVLLWGIVIRERIRENRKNSIQDK
ncbi:MAG: helix-turn-helix domain-containing protein [Clostridia bacterium]|nr:helix-turn-helix domain-containing protein [Clostridia bacterium]